jgi:hypothetical protein
VAQHFLVAAKFSKLVIVGGKLAHREQAVNHKHYRNQRDNCDHDTGIAPAENKLTLKHLGHPPHRILADQDR